MQEYYSEIGKELRDLIKRHGGDKVILSILDEYIETGEPVTLLNRLKQYNSIVDDE